MSNPDLIRKLRLARLAKTKAAEKEAAKQARAAEEEAARQARAAEKEAARQARAAEKAAAKRKRSSAILVKPCKFEKLHRTGITYIPLPRGRIMVVGYPKDFRGRLVMGWSRAAHPGVPDSEFDSAEVARIFGKGFDPNEVVHCGPPPGGRYSAVGYVNMLSKHIRKSANAARTLEEYLDGEDIDALMPDRPGYGDFLRDLIEETMDYLKACDQERAANFKMACEKLDAEIAAGLYDDWEACCG